MPFFFEVARLLILVLGNTVLLMMQLTRRLPEMPQKASFG